MGRIKGTDGVAVSVKNIIDLTSGGVSDNNHTHTPGSILGLQEYTRDEISDMVSLNSESGIQVVHNTETNKLDFTVDPLSTTDLTDYPNGIQNIISSMFTSNTTEGINTTYNDLTTKIDVSVDNFDVILQGDVTGSTTVSTFGSNIALNTNLNVDTGMTIRDDGVDLGTINTVDTLNFTGDNIIVNRTGDIVDISVSEGLSNQDVRDEIGTSVKGTVRDPNTNIETETGITVNYDSSNNTIELGTREFDINLTGDVTGSGTITDLNDVTIVTSHNAIEGITITKDDLVVSDAEAVRTLNFNGSNISTQLNPIDNSVLDISITNTVSDNEVLNIMKPKLIGDHDGLMVNYDHINQEFNLSVDPIVINLNGAITGSGTVRFDGTSLDSQVDITTSLGGGTAEISVSDEGNTQGTVTAINFVGGGITTAVSLDGQVATVYVPNSPANEPFITAVQGSENIPNARRLIAGTGISINDAGAAGDLTISANSDAILAKSQIAKDQNLVGQELEINFNSSKFIIPSIEDDAINGRINITLYDIKEYWYNQTTYDCGSLVDDEGPILDMGNLYAGIFETKPDLGSI